jgi:hypothetical protein
MEDGMGLAERRAIEHFKNDAYPGWLQQIEETAGFAVPVEIVWEELAVADHADSYAEFFPKVYFRPLVDALRAVTVDQLGKDAAREGLSKIVIRNNGGFYDAMGFTFQDGVLIMDHRPDANVDYVEERTKGLQRLIEAGL